MGYQTYIFSFFVTACFISQVLSQNVPRLTVTPSGGFMQIPEGNYTGEVVGILTAKDPDDKESLTIEIDHTDASGSLVQLSPPADCGPDSCVTVNITVNATLDRDYEPSQRPLYFKVTDKDGNVDQLRTSLLITDVNDCKPEFKNQPYQLTVPENEPIGTSLLRISASDPDIGNGGVIKLRLEDPLNIGNPFSLKGVDLFLTKALNYSINTFYQLEVHAMDNADPYNNATPANLIVNIEDVQNSPPYFIYQPYIGSIPENTETGYHILTVHALDGDRGVPNSIEYFFVEGGAEHNFTINSTSGTISVAGLLDADDEDVQQNGGLFRLTVNASEIIPAGQNNTGITWSTTSVSITVTDINDNRPVFTKPVYHASVAENSPKGIPLTMENGELIEVFDIDQVPNNRFNLSINTDNHLSSAFDTIPSQFTTIYGRSTIILNVNNTEFLDYETRTNITIQLKATENATYESETKIIVSILDVNDNSPIFDEYQRTTFMVHENVNSGTFVGMMKATDMESGVIYSLDGDEDNVFSIDANNGTITVNGSLDRETRSSYTIFVIATDQPEDENQQRATRIKITIDILDINDNAPEFTQLPSRRDIPEDSQNGTELLTVRATDRDNGTNQEIVYSLTDNGNITGFSINPDSGSITISGSLVGMVGSRYLTVMAKDKGIPPLNSTAHINLFVLDVNLHRPIFYKPSHRDYNLSAGILPSVDVMEEQPVESNVFSLYANDSDSGQNGEILYSILPDNSDDWQKFRVDRLTGHLTNLVSLDREVKENYTIVLTAEDQGLPSLETSITLQIVLLDIDDNPPSFENENRDKPFHLSVDEESRDEEIGQIFLATDKDATPIVCYYIIGGEMVNHFNLNKTSGILSLIGCLDRERKAKVNLVIQASRYCSQKPPVTSNKKEDFTATCPPEYDPENNTLLWVQIEVIDVNDQPPKFKQNELTAGFLYDVEFGTIVKELREEVTDDDVGINAITYFRLLGISTKDMEVDIGTVKPLILDSNGTVKTNMLFSSDMTGAFVLDIQAYDIGNLTSDARFEIYIISDIQRLKLVFMKTPDEVRAFKGDLIEELEKDLQFRIIVDKIATHQNSDGTPVITKSDMFIHARYLDTDKVVPAEELWRAFDFSSTVHVILDKFNVIETSPVAQQAEKNDSSEENMKKSLIIVTSGLALIAITLVLVLINLRSRYRRRLRAASTKTFGSSKDAVPDLISPGTNKYYASASNPVYMKELNIDLTEDSMSRNSIDDNEVGDKKATDSSEPEEQEIAITLYEENTYSFKDANRSSALDLVLQQYEESAKAKKGANSLNSISASDFSNIDDLEHSDI
ncbi:cadherin-23 [Patella vulgata]|uniref:cadherin-23 n=1 Tax=Patella vulgata TaxID=6465 RepID=UPI0024A99D94|nr:cadherin-23 [Patella vulgata]